jgi:hypothetical protein
MLTLHEAKHEFGWRARVSFRLIKRIGSVPSPNHLDEDVLQSIEAQYHGFRTHLAPKRLMAQVDIHMTAK